MWLFIFGLLFIFIILYFIVKNYKKIKKFNIEKEIKILEEDKKNSFPSIQIIENDIDIPLNKNKINDSRIKQALINIDNILPKSVIAGKNIKSSKELLNNNRAFFSAAKKGTENMQHVGKTGKVYGSQMVKAKDSNRMLYNKQTEFTKEDMLINSAGKNALINAGFNAASIIVSQYYMNEINNKLENIQNNINEISEFLDNEYQSKIIQIVSKLKEITDNKLDILNNEFSRDKRYNEIIDLEKECARLLGQANSELKNNIPNRNIEYSKYEKKIIKISKWFKRQQLLQHLLLEIGDLRYVLADGNETSKLSHTQYNHYLLQTNYINEKLRNFHIIVMEEQGIDIKALRKNGKFYNLRKNTVGKINEDWAYDKLNENTVKMIQCQTNIKKWMPYTKEKQDEIIKIQKYKGEYYNLIEEKSKDENMVELVKKL